MANCHQCKTSDMDESREGDCDICFATGVKFCPTCAMWEIGPKDAEDVKLFDGMKTGADPISLSAPRQHSQESRSSTSSLATFPLECGSFFPTIAAVCPYIENQLDTSITTNSPKLYGEKFKVYACEVFKKFQALYPTCKYNRVAIQVLLIMHLSSQERVQCRKAADEKADSYLDEVQYLKRWQTREIAVAHLRNHLTAIGTRFGSPVKALVGKETWYHALGLDDFEFYMKGFKSPTLMALDLKKLAGSTEKARETLEIAIILYHSLTAAREKSKLDVHWSQKPGSFLPPECLGMLSKTHYESIYGTSTDGTMNTATVDKLEALWDALDGVGLPSHPRFPDSDVPTGLEEVEQHYLQYLPTFDHPKSEASDRSECEKVVRKRVEATLEVYREAYAKEVHHKKATVTLVENGSAGGMTTTRTISIEATKLDTVTLKFDKKTKPSGSKESHIRTDLATTEQQKLDTFLRKIKSLEYLESVPGGAFEIKVSFSTGNDRRDTRRDLVLNPINALLEDESSVLIYEYSSDPEVLNADGTVNMGWDVEAFTDRVIAYMQDDFRVDQSFDDFLAKLILTTTDVKPMAWFPLKLKAKPYKEVFPACGFVSESLDVLNEHYVPTEGSSPRPSHYVDWRNHKDNWLYDCFHIKPRRRPLFGSLSLQPLIPEINRNYGWHTLVFDRQRIRHRCIHNFGDKQQPRRSMLLLLDDLLYARDKKDGAAGQAAKGRFPIVDNLLNRVDNIRIFGGLSIEEQWKLSLSRPYHKYPEPDYLLECQIFGGVDKSTEILAFATIVEEQSTIDYYKLSKRFYVEPSGVGAAQTHLSRHMGSAKLLGYQPVSHVPTVGYQRSNASDISGGDTREDLIDKNAADNASIS